eukprot:GHUV01030913.1.p1 GENE.GHUV01030913.1~~GHUV01030913.1.p1  ORF type:complete len:151 (-),score=9.40 GHUV01030913.1:135-587(-)
MPVVLYTLRLLESSFLQLLTDCIATCYKLQVFRGSSVHCCTSILACCVGGTQQYVSVLKISPLSLAQTHCRRVPTCLAMVVTSNTNWSGGKSLQVKTEDTLCYVQQPPPSAKQSLQGRHQPGSSHETSLAMYSPEAQNMLNASITYSHDT